MKFKNVNLILSSFALVISLIALTLNINMHNQVKENYSYTKYQTSLFEKYEIPMEKVTCFDIKTLKEVECKK